MSNYKPTTVMSREEMVRRLYSETMIFPTRIHVAVRKALRMQPLPPIQRVK